MKTTTKFVMVLIILCFACAFAGCSFTATTLNVPENVQVVDNVVYWNAVDGALGYYVSINGIERETATTSFDLSNLNIESGTECTIMVRAKGDGTLKNSSGYSQPISHLYVMEEVKEVLTDTIKNSIVNASSTNSTYYGVGRTINVITDEYANFTAESIGYGKVFDSEKLASLNWFKSFVGDMQAETFTGSSMEKLYVDANLDFKKSFNASASYGNVFSAGLENSFGFSAGLAYENTANEIYHTSSQYFGANLVAIDGYYDIEQFENVLSDGFIADIIALENGTTFASEIINKYGTHAVLAGYYGGKITCNSYIRNTSTKWDANAAFDYESKITAAIGEIISAGTSTSMSLSAKLEIADGTSSERFTATAIGGSNFQALSLQDFLANYGTWVNSMNNMSIEKSVIVGLPAKSLVSIWDLLPSEYSSAKTRLKDYFNSEVNSTNSDFLSKYERHYNEPIPDVDHGNTTDYAGGHGTVESPYLISNATHLKNIEKNMGAYFAITQDINLNTEWTSIGENGANYEAFTGTLDGGGHKIVGLKRTTTPLYDSDKTARFGLFAKLSGAIVKNIVFNNVDINFPNTNTNSNHFLIVGTLCAQAENSTIENVGVNGNLTLGGTKNNSYLYAGGLVGEIQSSVNIKHCYVKATMSSVHERIYQGGICGYVTGNNTSINYSYYVGSMNCNAGTSGGTAVTVAAVGGVIGYILKPNTAVVTNCYTKFDVRAYRSGTGYCRFAGIVGLALATENKNTVKDNYSCYKGSDSSSGNLEEGLYEIKETTKKLGTSNKVTESQLTAGSVIGALFGYNSSNFTTNSAYCWVYKAGQLPKLYWE